VLRRFCSIVVVIVACLAGLAACGTAGERVVVIGGTVIDPFGGTDPGPVTIFIEDGVIRGVQPVGSAPPAGARIIDAAGLYVMPGLADMHNHLRSGTFRPGNDQAAVLRGLLEWGVTTTFDPGVPEENFAALRAAVESDPAAYPRAFLIKGVFTTTGGWGKGYKPETATQARAVVRELKAAGSDGVKLMYDDMRWATTRPFAVMDREVMAAIIDEAHKLNMRAFAHAPILELAKEVLEGGIDCLLHGIISEPVDDEFIELMRRNDACYISTLTMFNTNAGYGPWADRLDAFDLEDRLDPKTLELFHKVPPGTARLDNVDWAAERLPVLTANLLSVHEAGIPVVIGTDSGIPGVLPGIAAQLEIVLHVEAGLTPREALTAATRNAARMMGQENGFGGVEEGMAADLLILEADPTADIGNIRLIRDVMRAGRLVD
jgi:imidazolonepropionase-like amidohydrolase